MIALLGATGRIGRHVAAALADMTHEVVALTRNDAALPVPTRRVDLRDPGSLAPALDGVERLFLLTGHGPDQDLLEAGAIDAAVRAGVRRIVKVSGGAPTLGPNAITSTAVAHWRSERRVEDAGVEFAFLRPSFLMQNLLGIVKPGGRLLPAPMGRAPIAMVDARDVAAVAAVALQQDEPLHHAWSLTGPRGVTFAEIARHVGSRYVPVPAALAARGMRRRGASTWEVEHAIRMAGYFAAGADAAPTRTVAEITRHPPLTVEDFLDEHVNQ
jgi:uncharacterized protein YbjT (DUF2867 family)